VYADIHWDSPGRGRGVVDDVNFLAIWVTPSLDT